MKCPLCKYEPKLKKNGDVQKRFEPFKEIEIIECLNTYNGYKKSSIGYCCPKCGIMFREVSNV